MINTIRNFLLKKNEVIYIFCLGKKFVQSQNKYLTKIRKDPFSLITHNYWNKYF